MELYGDPVRQRGPQPEHDLTDKAVRQRVLDLASAHLNAEVPNVWQFGAPCTTFCDFQLLNHGTRSFASPQKDGSRPDEVLGNSFANLAADLCEARMHMWCEMQV